MCSVCIFTKKIHIGLRRETSKNPQYRSMMTDLLTKLIRHLCFMHEPKLFHVCFLITLDGSLHVKSLHSVSLIMFNTSMAVFTCRQIHKEVAQIMYSPQERFI